MTGGHRRRAVTVGIIFVAFVLFLHGSRLCHARLRRGPRRPGGPAGALGHHRLLGDVVVLDAVASAGIGDACVLRARRPRPDPGFAGVGMAPLCRPHHRDGGGRRSPVAGARGAVRQCAGVARRRALARRLRGHRRAGDGRGRDFGRSDRRAVPRDRPAAHPVCRADPRRDHRRRLRHRGPVRGDPLIGDDVADGALPVAGVGRARARRGQPPLVAGPRRPRAAAGAGCALRPQRDRAGRRNCRLCAALRTARAGRRRGRA